jgi:hypothetical protein
VDQLLFKNHAYFTFNLISIESCREGRLKSCKKLLFGKRKKIGECVRLSGQPNPRCQHHYLKCLQKGKGEGEGGVEREGEK